MIQPEVKIDKKKKEAQREKIVMSFVYLVIAFAIIVLFFTAKSIIFPGGSNNQVATQTTTTQAPMSRMTLTSYDKNLSKEFMDKDNDGKCDACGMPIEQCIDSGQMQCSMDSKATIGILGSSHIHADFKIYINGKSINLANEDYYMKSSFIHVDDNQNKEDASGVLHIHATGVPLWIFFESIEMKFEKDCFTLNTGKEYCNNVDNSLKFYINGEKNDEFGDYVFKDLDKILISYGDKNEGISNQLNSITNYAQNH